MGGDSVNATQSRLRIEVCALQVPYRIYYINKPLALLWHLSYLYTIPNENKEMVHYVMLIPHDQRRAGLDVPHSMDGRDLTISFQLYQGKTRDDLLEYVCKLYHERISTSQDEGLRKALKQAMEPENWNSLHTPPQ